MNHIKFQPTNYHPKLLTADLQSQRPLSISGASEFKVPFRRHLSKFSSHSIDLGSIRRNPLSILNKTTQQMPIFNN